MRRTTLLITLLTLLTAVSCSSDYGYRRTVEETRDNGLTALGVEFEDDYGQMVVSIDQTRDFEYNLCDTSQVRVSVAELNWLMSRRDENAQPKFREIRAIGSETVKARNLNVLAVVDLTSPSELVAERKRQVQKIYSTFCHNNMFIAFLLPEGEVTDVMEVTPYVIEKYFEPRSAEGNFFGATMSRSYLFSSLLRIADGLKEDDDLRTALDSSMFVAEIVFSDNDVYDDETGIPYDPNQYKAQERIVKRADNLEEFLAVYFVAGESEEGGQDEAAVNLEKLICRKSGGMYVEKFDWPELLNSIRTRFGISTVDYEVVLDNPGARYYFGKNSLIGLKFSTVASDSEIVSVYRDYSLGTIYNPIVTGDMTNRFIFFSGVAQVVILVIVVFLVLQFLVPYVRYRIFRYKYVRKYIGPNMTVGKVMVPDQCYMCKAPFVPGDTIVAKCTHVVHGGCWEENECQCPEHGGGQCEDGAFFYDRNHLLNHRNSVWYLNWIFLAAVAATVSWTFFIAHPHTQFYRLIDELARLIIGRMALSDDVFFDVRHYQTTLLGAHIAFFLTIFISYFTVYRRRWRYVILDVLCRGIMAFIIIHFLFVFRFCIIFGAQIFKGYFFANLVAWSITALCVTVLCTVRTSVKLNKNRYLYALIVGAASSFFWSAFSRFDMCSDFILILNAYLIFCIGVTLVVARPTRRSGRAYLHLSGYIKDMDVALYKWYVQNPKAVVSIGRSVDCSIQMNWELMSHIAPVHAKIRMVNGLPFLFAVDGDVLLNDRVLKGSKLYLLHHGDTFVIGRTNFKYYEI